MRKWNRNEERKKLTKTKIKPAALLNPTDPANPFTLPLESLTKTVTVNTFSAYAAAREAVTAFAEVPTSDTPPTFIFTGNCTNVQAIPPLLDLGVSKSAAAHFIEIGSMSYGEKYKYVDSIPAPSLL